MAVAAGDHLEIGLYQISSLAALPLSTLVVSLTNFDAFLRQGSGSDGHQETKLRC